MPAIQRRSFVVLFTVLLSASPMLGQRFSDWSEPVNLGEKVNSPAGDFFPVISKDGLSLYFTSSRAHGEPSRIDWDIYVCTRGSVSEPWGTAQALGPNINTAFDEGAPAFSPDGHWMFFSSTRDGGEGGNDIYVSRRHDKRDDFGWEPAVNIGTGVNTDFNEASPAIVEDKATGAMLLYFDSNRPGGPGPQTDDAAHNGNDIYVSARGMDRTFGPPVAVEELNTGFQERQPAIRRDGLEIFFASNRTGGLGLLDLWVSTRETTSDPWNEPVNLGSAVNTALNDAGPALSFDATTLFFQATRPGGIGAFDVLATTRTKVTGRDPR
jgi:Periplasmic component of the Tol biopolymer transport system